MLPAILRADPIAIQPFGTERPGLMLLALALEVAVVIFIVRGCKLYWAPFFVIWLLFNVVTCFVLLPMVQMLLSAATKRPPTDVLVPEITVFLVEWLFLLGVANGMPRLQRPESQPLTVRRAMLASLLGNLTSFFAYVVLTGHSPA